MSTVGELVLLIERRLGLVSGSGVQVYGEDKIFDLIKSAFNTCFDMQYWKRFSDTYEFTLDGATGVATVDVSKTFNKFTDIKSIKTINGNLTICPEGVIPQIETGTAARYYKHKNNEKIFQIVPFTSTDTVYVYGRVKPEILNDKSEVPFDEEAIIAKVCYDYLVDDNDNQTAMQKYAEIFKSRISTLVGLDNSGEFNKERTYVINDTWGLL